MSKKKKPQTGAANQRADNQNELEPNEIDGTDSTTATMSQPAHPPLERPAWIDGAPVTADGRIIKEAMPKEDGQMRLRPEGGDDGLSAIADEEVQQKNWGDPYKAIFTCPEMGFELGENRRFKQRVFHFIDKPTEEILAELRENKFIYRGAEKAWTIPASAETRKLTDELARKWAGPGYAAGIER